MFQEAFSQCSRCFAFGFTACATKYELRGSFRPSQDGKTYLIVDDDNGGHCGPIKVDKKVWPHPIGEAGLIEPGIHTIECGGEIGFRIGRGGVYRVNYWGP